MPGIALGRQDGSATGRQAVTAVGTTQAGSPALEGFLAEVTTSAGQVSALLPTNGAAPILVRVVSATAATIFPPVGGSINGGAANAAFSVAQNKPTLFYPAPNGLDYVAVLSA